MTDTKSITNIGGAGLDFKFDIVPIEIKGLRLRDLTVTPNRTVPFTEMTESEGYQVSLGCIYHKAPEVNVMALALAVEMNRDRQNPKGRLAYLKIEMEGLFDYDAVRNWNLSDVLAHCASMLYGAIRGMIYHHTAALVGGAIILPGLSMKFTPKE